MASDLANGDTPDVIPSRSKSAERTAVKRPSSLSKKQHKSDRSSSNPGRRSNGRSLLKILDPVCVICLRTFSFDGKTTFSSGDDPQSEIPGELSREDDGATGSPRAWFSGSYDIYKRFLIMSSRFLKLEVTVETLLKGNEDYLRHNAGKGVPAFCEDCKVIVTHVCDLYAELQAVKLKLLWKLEKVEKLMANGRQAVTLEVYRELLQKLKLQLNTISGQRVHHFRYLFQAKCTLKRKASSGPRPLIPRGLFPEEWKVGFTACKQMMTRLIVVFLLAAAPREKVLPETRESCNSQEEIVLVKRKPGPKSRRKSRQLCKDENSKRPIPTAASTASVGEESVIKTENDLEKSTFDNDQHFDDTNFDDDDLHRGFSSDDDTAEQLIEDKTEVSKERNLDDEPASTLPDRRWNFRKTRQKINLKDLVSSDSGSDYEPDQDLIPDFEVKKKADAEGNTSTKKNMRGFPRAGDCNPTVPCPKCKKLLLDKRSLASHLILVHDTRLSYSCPTCGEKFIRWKDLRNHKREKHRKASTNRRWLRTPKSTECPICNEVFPSELAFLTHRRDIHKSGPRGPRGRKKQPKSPDSDPSWQAPPKENPEKSPKLKSKKKSFRTGRKRRDQMGRPSIQTTCKLCSRVFSSQVSYKLHYRQEHTRRNRKEWPCKLCDIVCSTYAKLLDHRRNSHPKIAAETPSNKCSKCSETFPTLPELRAHKKEVHKIVMSKHECPICFRTVCGGDRFQWHLQAHEDKKLRNSVLCYCEVCGKHFYREDNLAAHMAKDHNNLFTCSICKEDFTTGKLLRDHLVTHEKFEKYFHCMMCFRGFSTQQFYDIHKKIAHKDSRFVSCDHELCNETFENFDQLNAHLQTHADSVAENAEGSKVLVCDNCGKGHLSEYQLTIHRLTHTPHNVGKPGYDCPIGGCGQTVRYLPTLLTHYNRVHGKGIMPITCYTCGKGFSCREWYKVHKQICGEDRSKEKNENWFCRHCGETFPDKDKLTSHQVTEHNYKRGLKKVREWVDCPEENCSRRFPTANMLNIHLVRVHGKGEKAFTCEKCGRSFVDRGNLNEHMISHAPPKCMCDVCGKLFKKPYEVRQHRAAVHSEGERQKNWCCVLCGLSYYSKQGLRYHDLAMHADKSDLRHECQFCGKKYGRKMLLTMHMKSCGKLHGVNVDEGEEEVKQRKKPGRKPKEKLIEDKNEVPAGFEQNPTDTQPQVQPQLVGMPIPFPYQQVQPIPGTSYEQWIGTNVPAHLHDPVQPGTQFGVTTTTLNPSSLHPSATSQ